MNVLNLNARRDDLKFDSVKTNFVRHTYKNIAIVGKIGAGKTRACMHYIEDAIKKNKELKQDWKIVIVTDFPDEYRQFKPFFMEFDSKLKNCCIVINTEQYNKHYEKIKNCLLVFDCNQNNISKKIELLAVDFKHKQINTILCYNSLAAISPVVIDYLSFMLLYKIVDPHNNRVTTAFRQHSFLMEIAQSCLLFCNHKRFEKVFIDFDDSKINCSEKAFYKGTMHVITKRIIPNFKQNIKCLELLGGLALRISKFYVSLN